MTPITRSNLDALLDAGALQVSLLTADEWFSIRRSGRTSDDGVNLFVPYVVEPFGFFGSITEYEFQVNGGVLPSDYYRVRQDG